MAENEIENLKENNLIDEKELNNRTEEKAKLVEEGQVSASELRNVIDIDAVLEEAKKNDLYSNMLEPCQKMGVNINAQLIAFFEEEVTDLSDIKVSIQRGMERIKNRINKDNPYLAFDDSGNIDYEAIINKTPLEDLPEYIRRNIENVEKTDIKDSKKNLPPELENIDDSIKDAYISMFEITSKIPKEKISEARNNKNEIIAVTVEGYTEEQNKVMTLMLRLKERMQKFNPKEIGSQKDKKDEIMKILSDYYIFIKKDLSQFPENKEIKDSYIQGCQAMLRSLVPTLNLDEIDFTDEEAAIGNLVFNLNKAMRGDIFKADEMIDSFRDAEKQFEQDFENGKNKIVAEKINVTEYKKLVDDFDVKQQELFMDQIYLGLIDRHKKSTNVFFARTNVFVERAENALIKGNPKYYEEAKALYEKNEYIDIYIDIIKDQHIKSRMLNPNEKIEYNDVSEKNEAFLKIISTFEGLKSSDEQLKKDCYERLLEYYPDTKNKFDIEELMRGDNLQVNTFNMYIYQSVLIEFGDLAHFKRITNTTDFEAYTEQLVDTVIKGRLLGGVLGNEKLKQQSKDLFEDKDFNAEAQKKIANRQTDIANKEVLQNFLIEINELQGIRDFEPEKFNDLMKLELISKSVAAVIMYKDMKGRKESTFVNTTLKDILADYIPDVFEKDGTLKSEFEIGEIYNEFLAKRGIKAVFGIDDVMDQMFSKVESNLNDKTITSKMLDEIEKKLAKTNFELGKDKALSTMLEDLKIVEVLKSYINENVNDENLLEEFNKHIDGFDKRTSLKIEKLSGVVAKQREKEEIIDSSSDYIEKVQRRIDNIRNGKFKKDKTYQLIERGKDVIIKEKISQLEEKISQEEIIGDDVKKEIFELYFGSKEKIENDINLDIEFVEFFRRINPKIVEEDEINPNNVLAEYNELTGENIEDISYLVSKYENELLLDFVTALDEEINPIGKDQSKFKIIDKITDKVNSNVESTINKNKEKKELEEELVLLYLYKSEIDDINEGKGGIKREVEAVKALVILAELIDEKECKESNFFQGRKETIKIERQIQEVVRTSLKTIFPDTIKEDGSINLEQLFHNVEEYLKINDPKFFDDLDDNHGNIISKISSKYYGKNMQLSEYVSEKVESYDDLINYAKENVFFEGNVYKTAVEQIRKSIEENEMKEDKGAPITQEEINSLVNDVSVEMRVENPGEELAKEIADAEVEIPEISDDEVRDVIEGRGEDVTVSQSVVQEKDKQIADDEVKPTFEKNSEVINMAENGIEEVIEDVVEEPKTAQVMVAEDINVGENEEEKSLVVKNENPIRVMFEKARKTIRDVLENVASKFGFGTSSGSDSSSNDTTNSSSSSSGTEKSVQDTGVKGLTGYDQIQLVSPVEQEKTEGTGEPKTEKATRESDDQERG